MFKIEITANTYAELQSKLREMTAKANKVPMDGTLEHPTKEPDTFPEFKVPPKAAAILEEVLSGPIPTGDSESEYQGVKEAMEDLSEKPKRKRRTKAEMDAAETASQTVNIPDVALPVVPPPPPAPVVSLVPPVAAPQAVVQPKPEAIPHPKPVNLYAHTFESFKKNVMSVLGHLVKDKKITQEYINQLKDYFDVKELWEVFKNDEQLKELYDQFVEYGFIQKVG